MKSFTMKALAVAVIGMAGMSLASAATCPSDPAQSGGGAWNSKSVFGGGALTVTTPGLDGTNCAMYASINAGAGALASSAVQWSETGTSEATYRFRFYLDPSTVGTTNAFSGLQGVQVFTANSPAAFPASGGSVQVLRVSLVPGSAGAKQVTFIAACNNAASQNVCSSTPVVLAAGSNVIEGQIIIGASGTGAVNYWVNKTAGDSASPTGSVTITGGNAGWVGINSALMGLAATTNSFRSNQATKAVVFDEFDSRRQTYIGP
jgi:hypothetical protein